MLVSLILIALALLTGSTTSSSTGPPTNSQPGPSNSQANKFICFFKGKNDPMTEANDLMLSTTFSNHLADNFEKVGLAADNHEFDNNPDAKLVLEHFLQLETLHKRLEQNSLECSDEEFKLLRQVNELMIRLSDGDPFKKPRSKRRLNSMIIDVQNRYGVHCFGLFRRDFERQFDQLDGQKLRAILLFSRFFLTGCAGLRDQSDNRLDELINAAKGVHLKKLNSANKWTWQTWHKTFRKLFMFFHNNKYIRTRDPTTGKLEVSEDKVRKLFDEMIIQTCSYFDANENVVNVIEKTFALVQSINFTPDMYKMSKANKDVLHLVVPGYQMCKYLKTADVNAIIVKLTHLINLTEAVSSFLEFENLDRIRRS